MARLTALLLPLWFACSPGATSPPVASGPPAPVESGAPDGAPLLEGSALDRLALQNQTELARVSVVAVAGQPFERALRAESLGGAADPWSVQLGASLSAPIQYRDVLLVSFYLRAPVPRGETGEGQTEVVIEQAREPWSKLLTQPVTAGAEWTRIDLPCEASGSYAAGEAQLVFRLGYEPQTIEIAGLEIRNFGRHRALADLPRTRQTYVGRELDAAWRAEAAARIEQHRKADVEIVVTDGVGKPVEGAAVRIEMTRHAFRFGTAINGRFVASPGPDADRARYLAEVPRLFNTVVLENELKWQPLAGDWGPGFTLDVARDAVRWARGKDLDVRGHVLVWPGWKNLPARLRQLEHDREGLRREVREHVREMATAMRGELVDWDVVNEPWDNHDLIDRLGREELVAWFREAREADPRARLYINDYGILSGGGGDTQHRATYEDILRYLIAQGAPVDGIGLQGHFGAALTAPADLEAILDRFGALGPPLLITEYDVVIDDEQLAGDYTRDFLTVLFAHPRVEGFLMWGFWDGRHWKNNSAMFRRDWSLKPAGKAYQQLVLGDWWTRVEGRTAATGSFRGRGFLGRHRVTVQQGAVTRTAEFSLGVGGTRVEVRLAPAE